MTTFEIYKDWQLKSPPHPKAYYHNEPGMYDNWRIDVESLEELMSIINTTNWSVTVYPAKTLSTHQVMPIIVFD